MLGAAPTLTPFNHLTGRPPTLQQDLATDAGPLPHLADEACGNRALMPSCNHAASDQAVDNWHPVRPPVHVLQVAPSFRHSALESVALS